MRGNEHVVRFNVAVHQASTVHLVEAHEHRVHHGGSRMRRHGSALGEQLAQRAARDEFHDEVDGHALGREVMHGNEIWVL